MAFDKVFEAAGIKPGRHGWTVERLQRPAAARASSSRMDRAAAQKALLARSGRRRSHVEDLVKDAVARDQALDAFEEFVRGKMDDRMEARAAASWREIEAQIAGPPAGSARS